MEDDTSKLWVPQDTDVMETRRWREEQYPITLYQLELLVAPKEKKAHPADVLQPHLVCARALLMLQGSLPKSSGFEQSQKSVLFQASNISET